MGADGAIFSTFSRVRDGAIRRLRARRRVATPSDAALAAAADLLSARHLVFVGGLHRSGTTLLASMLGSHPEASTLTGTGHYADEGQHVQTVVSTASKHGGAGGFAFDPSSHLDASDVHSGDAARLVAQWTPYWDTDQRLLVEKSPINMVRFRYLQALVPTSTSILIRRHPVAVAYATQKWSRSTTRSLLEHWIRAHDVYEQDRPDLRDVIELTYEELVADPDDQLRRIHHHLGLDHAAPEVTVRSAVNDKYFRMWREDPTTDAGALRDLYPAIRHHGYDLDELDV